MICRVNLCYLKPVDFVHICIRKIKQDGLIAFAAITAAAAAIADGGGKLQHGLRRGTGQRWVGAPALRNIGNVVEIDEVARCKHNIALEKVTEMTIRWTV
jgi:hypothetical protein